MTDEETPGGKGKATPSRKQAEAERKAALKRPKTRKERAAQDRKKYDKRKADMAAGKDSALPARDQGPVRGFARDFVDRRWNVAEFLLPVLIIMLIASYVQPSKATGALTMGVYLWALIATVIDSTVMTRRLKKALRALGHEPKDLVGVGAYSIMRSTQLRFLRLPRPRVKRGTKLPGDK